VTDLLSVGGVVLLMLAIGLSVPHWLKRWRMDRAFSALQRTLGSGQIQSRPFGWPSFSGVFLGRPCGINFETTLIHSAHGALGDLAARYRVGLAHRVDYSVSFAKRRLFSRWFGRRSGNGAVAISVGGHLWHVVSSHSTGAGRLANDPAVAEALKSLSVCTIVTLDREWMEALEVEVSRRELHVDRFVSMLTLLTALAGAVETCLNPLTH